MPDFRALLFLPLLLGAVAVQAANYQVGDRLQGASAEKTGPYQEISWDALLPKEWDPMKVINELKLDKLQDSDPRALEAMEKLKRMWNDAPSNPAMQGKAIRIAGFMVPLEWGQREVKEFLLVPYFGACIHVPPPPANQIIHVLPTTPARGVKSMDAVWITGKITRERTDSYMGVSGYRIAATRVEPYREERRGR